MSATTGPGRCCSATGGRPLHRRAAVVGHRGRRRSARERPRGLRRRRTPRSESSRSGRAAAFAVKQNRLYHNEGEWRFPGSRRRGRGGRSDRPVALGRLLFDADRDGRLRRVARELRHPEPALAQHRRRRVSRTSPDRFGISRAQRDARRLDRRRRRRVSGRAAQRNAEGSSLPPQRRWAAFRGLDRARRPQPESGSVQAMAFGELRQRRRARSLHELRVGLLGRRSRARRWSHHVRLLRARGTERARFREQRERRDPARSICTRTADPLPPSA